MGSTRPRRRWLLAVPILAVALLASAPFAVRSLLWWWEQNPILRGREVAREAGCFTCHQPWAGVEIPNPGSRWGTVPRFGAGNAFMYASERQGIEEFVRFGAPRSWLDDPDVRERLESQHLRMPAYDDLLSDAEIGDVVAYLVAVEGVERAGGEAAAAGRQLAREHGCLSCHGFEGAGGLTNPRSLGGFIPGFLGRNFEDLVRDREEFREWVLDGTNPRLAKNPIVDYFWDRQQISMPAYRGDLTDAEVDQLWAWVTALRAEPASNHSGG